jgi:hypothetical protein
MENELQENYKEYLRKLENKIHTLNRYMNNTKWCKLLNELDKNGVKFIIIKLLLWNGERIIDNYGYNKTGFDDVSVAGPFMYKEIEYLIIKKEYRKMEWRNGNKINRKENNIEINEIKSIIDKIGKFEYDINGEEIKIYGYK